MRNKFTAVFALATALILSSCGEHSFLDDLLAGNSSSSQDPSSSSSLGNDERKNGYLFIHGGGAMSNAQRNKFIDLAGGASGKILVVPFTSDTPEEQGLSSAQIYINRGIDADYVAFKKEDADLPENLRKLDGVTGIWFPGGSQTLLRNTLLGSVFLERLKDIYWNGGVIGGTSAGAAIMSKAMLANATISEGFGFIDFAIIDQHFSERERQNRLLNAVQEQNLAGIGIDEVTAVVFDGVTETFDVMGSGSVTVYEPQPTGIKTQIFRAGDRFTISK